MRNLQSSGRGKDNQLLKYEPFLKIQAAVGSTSFALLYQQPGGELQRDLNKPKPVVFSSERYSPKAFFIHFELILFLFVMLKWLQWDFALEHTNRSAVFYQGLS